MEKAWNKDGQFFGQSYEDLETIDSAVLIMPLVFFIQPVISSRWSSIIFAYIFWWILVGSEIHKHSEAYPQDTRPRRSDFKCKISSQISFLHWLKLSWQNLVYRYDTNKSDDGVGGEEGTFCLCTLWYTYSVTLSRIFWFHFLRCIEALTRAGAWDRPLLQRAIGMFEVMSSSLSLRSQALYHCRISFCIPTTLGYARKKFLRQEKGSWFPLLHV